MIGQLVVLLLLLEMFQMLTFLLRISVSVSRLVDHKKHGVLPTTSHCCLSASCINLESQVRKWDHVRQLWGRFNDILPSYELQARGNLTIFYRKSWRWKGLGKVL